MAEDTQSTTGTTNENGGSHLGTVAVAGTVAVPLAKKAINPIVRNKQFAGDVEKMVPKVEAQAKNAEELKALETKVNDFEKGVEHHTATGNTVQAAADKQQLEHYTAQAAQKEEQGREIARDIEAQKSTGWGKGAEYWKKVTEAAKDAFKSGSGEAAAAEGVEAAEVAEGAGLIAGGTALVGATSWIPPVAIGIAAATAIGGLIHHNRVEHEGLQNKAATIGASGIAEGANLDAPPTIENYRHLGAALDLLTNGHGSSVDLSSPGKVAYAIDLMSKKIEELKPADKEMSVWLHTPKTIDQHDHDVLALKTFEAALPELKNFGARQQQVLAAQNNGQTPKTEGEKMSGGNPGSGRRAFGRAAAGPVAGDEAAQEAFAKFANEQPELARKQFEALGSTVKDGNATKEQITQLQNMIKGVSPNSLEKYGVDHAVKHDRSGAVSDNGETMKAFASILANPESVLNKKAEHAEIKVENPTVTAKLEEPAAPAGPAAAPIAAPIVRQNAQTTAPLTPEAARAGFEELARNPAELQKLVRDGGAQYFAHGGNHGQDEIFVRSGAFEGRFENRGGVTTFEQMYNLDDKNGQPHRNGQLDHDVQFAMQHATNVPHGYDGIVPGAHAAYNTGGVYVQTGPVVPRGVYLREPFHAEPRQALPFGDRFDTRNPYFGIQRGYLNERFGPAAGVVVAGNVNPVAAVALEAAAPGGIATQLIRSFGPHHH